MNIGRVYVWQSDPNGGHYGRLRTASLALRNLESVHRGDSAHETCCRLSGRHVRVLNAGAVSERDPESDAVGRIALGNARPNEQGDFLFDPGRGGGRADKIVFDRGEDAATEFVESGVAYPQREFRARYAQAAHFGEVNSYFHLDRMAAYVNAMLRRLDAPILPRVTAVVNAHDAATEYEGMRDGLRRGDHWVPFQGGHYRLSRRSRDPVECHPVCPQGEIHLGAGRQLLEHGALARLAGGRYRANASHNAGILYHEYGHHITRHTADFRVNVRHHAERQDNRKTGIDEGTSDYWAAAMLGTPHIWILHHRHDAEAIHPRSLVSRKTMADYDGKKGADPHANGTIWAAALWDLRHAFTVTRADGAHAADLLVLKTLLLLGQLGLDQQHMNRRNLRRARSDFSTGLSCLLLADSELHGGRHQALILSTFAKRGIEKPANGAPLLVPANPDDAD